LSRQGWDWFCDSKKENVQNKVNDRKTTPPQETSVKRPPPDDNGVSLMFHVRKRRDRSCPWLPILIGARGRNRIRIDHIDDAVLMSVIPAAGQPQKAR
jgi:hypothetical protein